MAEMVITELRRTGSGADPTPVTFRWSSQTHSSMTNPLDLSLKITTSRRMPAGADMPVEQVLSAQWEPFTVEGEWNDKWAGAGFAQSMRIQFPQMVGRTQLVRFQIDQDSLVGLVTNVKTKYYTRDRVGYSFTFSPHINEAVGSFQQSANQVPPQPINQRVDIAVNALNNLVLVSNTASDEIPTQNFDIEDSKGVLAPLIDTVNTASAAVLNGSTDDPTRTLLAAAGAFRSVRAAALQMFFAVSDKRSDLTVAFDDAINILKFDEWRTSTLQSSVLTVGTSRDAEIDLQAKATKATRAIHKAKANETLERISLRYYGTADNWKAIFDANNLTSLILNGGELLMIPERTS